MPQLSLSVCPICHEQDSLSYEKMEVRGRSHEWYECAECGSALLWLGDDQWAYQKVGREDKAHLLKQPMSENELLALLPEQEDTVPAPEVAEEVLDVDEEDVTSLFSRDWPEYDEDPFAFLFQDAPEEGVASAPPAAEEEFEEDEPDLSPTVSEEVAEVLEASPATEAEEEGEAQGMDPFAGLFSGEWEEAEEAEASPADEWEGSELEAPTPTDDEEEEEEEPDEAGQESPAIFSRAWFEEAEAAQFSPITEEELSDLEEVSPDADVGDDWPAQQEGTPTLMAEEGEPELKEAAFIAEARGDLPAEVEGGTSVRVRRDLPVARPQRSSLGRVIPWLLALCIIAFLFLVGIAIYQIVTGASLF
ncbi:MAG: hypothetical protein ACK2UC_10335 [Anaerolineae bacterium]